MPQNRFWNLLSKKLAGEASNEELLELEVLVKQYPELIFAAEQIEQIWQQQPKKDQFDSELSFQSHLNSLHRKGISFPELESPLQYGSEDNPPSNKKKWLIAAAVLVVAFASMFAFWPKNSPGPEPLVHNKSFVGEISTRMGNRIRMVLPDSTIVWLNAGSKLTYNEKFGVDNRNTTLSGEAYFDVRKSSVPFIIHANGVQIKVLGTAFNVKSYPTEKTIETSLVRGQVEITIDKRPGEKFMLKPNEKLIVRNEALKAVEATGIRNEPMVVLSNLTVTRDNSIIETSWVEDKLIFQDESFAELAVKLERWYGVSIEIKNERIAKERISGTFTDESVYEALELLQMTTPFHFTIKSNKIIITE